MAKTMILASEHLTVIVFYTVIVLLIAHFRKKFEFHAWVNLGVFKFPLVAQLKTKLGLNLMKNIGEKHSRLVMFIATIGIYAGYLGMFVVLGYVVFGFYQLFADPSAPAVFTPVIPGAKIPGSPISFPFFHTLIALFVAVLIHEFSHGVVSRASKIPVKSSGYAQVGPFSAAFVEPDEKILEKASPKVQNAIFAAGPWSNFLTAGIVMLILAFVFNPLTASFYAGSTMTFDSVVPDSPAELAGLEPLTVYSGINDKEDASINILFEELTNAKPGDSITFIKETGEQQLVILGDKDGQAFIGIEGIQSKIIPSINPILYSVFEWINKLFVWIFILSVGLGMGNLIPAGPVDGGRMFLIACQKFFGKKKGEKIWAKTAIVLFGSIIILFIVPIFRAVF